MTYEAWMTEVEQRLRQRGLHLNIRTVAALSTRLRIDFSIAHQSGASAGMAAADVYNHICRLKLESCE